MTSDSVYLIDELDPAKKTYGWSSNVITSLRINSTQLKNVLQARNNRAVMYSMQPLIKVRDSFDDVDFKNSIEFLPVPVLEPILNSIVEDMVKRPPKAELRAEDPTALTPRFF